MIDLDIIREKYASMTDEQLLYLAKEDSKDLTEEAIGILKEEFVKRGLDMNVFIPVEKEQQNEEEREVIAGFYNPGTGADDSLLGRNYLSLNDPAKEMEIAEQEKNVMANLTEENTHALIKKCDRAIWINGIVVAIGIAVTLGTYLSVAEKGGSFTIAWGAIAFGGYGLIKALDAKSKIKATLQNSNTIKENFNESSTALPGTEQKDEEHSDSF